SAEAVPSDAGEELNAPNRPEISPGSIVERLENDEAARIVLPYLSDFHAVFHQFPTSFAKCKDFRQYVDLLMHRWLDYSRNALEQHSPPSIDLFYGLTAAVLDKFERRFPGVLKRGNAKRDRDPIEFDSTIDLRSYVSTVE